VNAANQQWSRWVSWSIAGAAILVSVLAPIVVVGGWSDADIGDSLITVVGTVVFLLVGPVYGVVGAAIVSNQKRNSIGWVMMFVALGMTAGVLAETLVPVSKPEQVSVIAAILLVLGGLAWVFFIFPVFHLMLTFPTGRALSRAWRPFLLLELLALAFVFLTGLFGETVSALDGMWTVDNPLGFIPDLWDGELVSTLFQASLLVLLGAGLASMVLRFLRASAIERQQLKSLVFAVAFFTFVFTAMALISGGEDSQLVEVLLPLSLIGIGLAVGVAVLRYRLYEIDRFVSRTVTYTVVVGLLAGIVAVVAATIGTRFESPLIVAGTTLAVAAGFNPLRRQVQRIVELRFNRSRYDAEKVMNEFAASLRDRVEEGSIATDWREVVVATMQPASASVWVRHN
jgi:hypothetical protein